MSPLMGQMFFRAFSFFTFHRVVAHLQQHNISDSSSNSSSSSSGGGGSSRDLPASTLMAAGAVTGLVISAVETPIDLVKTKLQIQVFYKKVGYTGKSLARYSTVSECVRFIASKHGAAALWQGWTATAIRNVPANGVFFPVNEIMKRKLAQGNGIAVDELEIQHRLMAGATAGMSYWVGMYPLDRIKGAIQAQGQSQRRTYAQTVRWLWSSGGIRNMYTGLVPCAARSLPACSCMFATVDLTRSALSKQLGL